MPDGPSPYLDALNLLDELVGSTSEAGPVPAVKVNTVLHVESAPIQVESTQQSSSAAFVQASDKAPRNLSEAVLGTPTRIEAALQSPPRTKQNTSASVSRDDSEARKNLVLARTPTMAAPSNKQSNASLHIGPSSTMPTSPHSRQSPTQKAFAEARKQCLLRAEEEEACVQALESQLARQAPELSAARSAERLSASKSPVKVGGALDCSQVLHHSIAVGGRSLLQRAEERATETSERIGILGEREDPTDGLWAEILSQQAHCISELLFENRSLHAQSDLRARLAQGKSAGQADKSIVHELRNRTAIQKLLTSKLLDWTAEASCANPAADSCGRLKAADLEWRRCDVEEAIGHFRTTSPHAELVELLAPKLGRAIEVRNIPAILCELLEHDVAAAAEVLLLECARLELALSVRRSTGLLAPPESRWQELRRAGLVCCTLAEEVEALRAAAKANSQ